MPLYAADVPTLKVTMANEETARTLKTIYLPISIENATFIHPTHVFNKLPVPLILGDDFLEAHQDTLSFNGSTAKLTLVDSTNQKLDYINPHQRRIPNIKNDITPDQMAAVQWEAKIKIPANTLKNYVIPTTKKLKNNVCYLIKAESDNQKLISVPQIATCDEQSFSIYIANPHKKDVESTFTVTATPVTTVKNVKKKEDNSIRQKYKSYPLSTSQQQKLNDLLENYSNVLADKSNPLGQTDRIEHIINTGDERPIKQLG